MARIVCQVLQQPERVTFIWSQGQAFFEPYHLVGAEAERFHDAARQANRQLGAASRQLGAMGQGGSAEALARAGHELYRLIFPAGDEGSTPRLVQEWLKKLHDLGDIESLEVVGDAPGRVPWNAVCEEAQPNLAACWGVRYPLTTGRRVNPLRLDPVLSQPHVLLVLDSGAALEERAGWQKEAGERGWRSAMSVVELRQAIDAQCPDLICWVGRARNSELLLGDETVTPSALRGFIDASQAGNLEPLILIQTELTPEFLETAAALFPGLIAWQATLSGAGAILREGLGELFGSGKQIGQVLRELRQKHGWPALALTAYCPPQMCLAIAEIEDERVVYELPDEPYAGLSSLDRVDRPLLGGRDRDLFQFCALLDQQAGKLLLLHGEFGVGKTSFLRAGVMASLEDDAHGFMVLSDRTEQDAAAGNEEESPSLTIRASCDLAGQFAEALCAFCAQPFRGKTPVAGQLLVPLPAILGQVVAGGGGVTAPGSQDIQELKPASTALTEKNVFPATEVDPLLLWQALDRDPGLLGRLLDALTRDLPKDLVIVIEQGEELISLAQGPADISRRRRALDMLVRAARLAPRCKLIFSMRTDFLGRLRTELPAHADQAVCEYLLPELSREQLLEVLLLPSSNEVIPFAEQAPFQKYHTGFDENFAEKLVDLVMEAAGNARQSAVALLQAAANRLHARAKLRNLPTITSADLRYIVGVKEAAKRLAEERIKTLKLSRRAKAALPGLLRQFGTSQPDGTVFRELYSLEETQRCWRRPDPVEAEQAIQQAEASGLLTSQVLLVDGEETIRVSLANDTLARVAQDWTEERSSETPAWNRGMIDTLWIMIPLLCVAASLSFFLTKRTYYPDLVAAQDKAEQAKEEREIMAAQVKAMTLPEYVGHVQQAHDAWQQGNLLRMRQLLLTQQVKAPRAKERSEDIRGFEWYYLWRLANSEKWALPGHEAPIASLAVSPDGKLLASAGLEGKLYLWNLESGTKRATLQGHVGAVNAVTFADDGKWLVSAGADKTVRLWQVPAGKDAKHLFVKTADKELAGHKAEVFALAAHAKTVISAGADKTIIVWDLEKFAAGQTLPDQTAAVHALAFAANGKQFASADAAGKVLIWDASSTKVAHAKEVPNAVLRTLAFSPDGKWLLAGGSEGSGSLGEDQKLGIIRVWDAGTGTAKAVPGLVHGSEVFGLAFSPDGKWLASAGRDNFVRLWDGETLQEIGIIKGHLGWVRSVAFSRDSQSVASGSFDATVKVWPARPSQDCDLLRTGGPLSTVAISGDDRLLAAAGKEGSVHIWNLASNKLLYTIKGLKGPVASLSFGGIQPNLKLAAAVQSGKDEGLVQVWKIEEKDGDLVAKETRTLPAKGESIECLAFGPDGSRLAWGGSGKSVLMVDLDREKSEPVKFGDNLKPVRSLAFRSDGQLLAAGTTQGVRVWIVEGAAEFPGSPYDEQAGAILGLAVNLNILLAATADGLVQFWLEKDVESPYRFRWTYRGHIGPAYATTVAVSNESLIFASAGADRTIKIWDPFHGDRLTLRGHTGAIRALAVSRGGVIASAGDDGTVRLWRAAAPVRNSE